MLSRPGQPRGERKRLLDGRRGKLRISEPEYFCSKCQKSLFPLKRLIGVDPDCNIAPAVLQKVVYSWARSGSFAQAESDLKTLAECQISSHRIRRWTEHIGNERVEQTAQAKAAYHQTHLPARHQCPDGIQVPKVACVEVDGGHLQIRERCTKQNISAHQQSPDCSAHVGYWRESKVRCLLRMTSITYDNDP